MLASLRFRLWLTYMLVVGVVLTIIATGFFVFLVQNPGVDRSELQRLRLSANLIARRSPILDVGLDQVSPERLEQAARRLDGSLQARVAVYAPDGSLLVDSRLGEAAALPNFSTFSRRLRTAAAFRTPDGQSWLYAQASLKGGNTLILAAPRPPRSLWSLFREEFLPPFLRALTLALILSILLAFWISRWVSAPLQRLAAAARSLSTADFQPVPLEGPGEVQAVGRAFNEMGQRLGASQRSQRDFIANVSHDLKTPLTSIQGYAQAILDGATDSTTAAQVISVEAGRMHRMLVNLLDLARLEAGMLDYERLPLDLGDLLRAQVVKVGPQAQRSQVDLQLDLAGEPPLWVTGDADRLSQVFANLLDNALKFTPAGGQVQVAALAAKGWAVVRLADSGPGIPEAELERVFERFYQVDKARSGGERGAGLGLAIARQIVQAHGGTIQAAHRGPGEAGCIFTVRLPLTSPASNTAGTTGPGYTPSGE
jgi:two-component system OmpR family sensor kinase